MERKAMSSFLMPLAGFVAVFALAGCITERTDTLTKFDLNRTGEVDQQRFVENQIVIMKKKIRKLPMRADYHARLARYYFIADMVEDNYEHAVKTIKKAIALDPRNGKYHFMAGMYYQKMNDLENADQSYRKAIKFSRSGYSGPRMALAYVLGLQDKNREAIREYENVIELFPDQPTALYYLASNYDCINEPEKAIEYFEKCAALESPHQENAREQLMRLKRLQAKR